MYVIHLFDSHNNPFYKWRDETWGFARGDTDLVRYAVGTSSGFRKGPLPAMLMRLKRPALLGEVPLKVKADWAQDEHSPCSQRVRTQSSKMGSSLNIHTSHVYWALVLSKADRVPVLGNGSAGRENIHQTTKSTMNYSGLLAGYKGLQEVAWAYVGWFNFRWESGRGVREVIFKLHSEGRLSIKGCWGRRRDGRKKYFSQTEHQHGEDWARNLDLYHSPLPLPLCLWAVLSATENKTWNLNTFLGRMCCVDILAQKGLALMQFRLPLTLLKGSRVNNLNIISENLLTPKLLLVTLIVPKMNVHPFLREAMDMKWCEIGSGWWGWRRPIDIINLLSRVSEIRMLCRPSSTWLFLSVNLEILQGEEVGKQQNYSPSEV